MSLFVAFLRTQVILSIDKVFLIVHVLIARPAKF